MSHRHQTIVVDYVGRTDGQPVFVGYAAPGLSAHTAEPIWSIFECLYDGFPTGNFIERIWADGDNFYDNIWDNRAVLSYF